MKKDTVLIVAVIGLLVLNLGTLGYLFVSHDQHPPRAEGPMPPPPGHRRFDSMIIDRLHLTSEQVAKFDTLKHAHHDTMMTLDDRYDSVLHSYFDLLGSSLPELPNIDSIAKTRDGMEKQRDGIEKQKDAIEKQKGAMEQQRDAMERQNDAMQRQKDAMEQQLSAIQKEKAAITFEHFAKLKAICTPEQQKSFDSLLPHLMEVIAPPPPPPPPPPPGMPPPPPGAPPMTGHRHRP